MSQPPPTSTGSPPGRPRVVPLSRGGTDLPPEVAALGQVKSVHKPNILVGSPGDTNLPSYLVFAEAIVAAQADNTFLIVQWEEIVETDRKNSFFQAFTSAAYRAVLFRLTTADGFILTVYHDVTEVKELEETIIAHTNAVLVPKALDVIAQGGVARFGHLGLSREALHFKNHVYPWSTVKSLALYYWKGIQIVRVISSRWLWGLIPVCLVEPNRLPNGAAFVETLRQTAPRRLLTEG